MKLNIDRSALRAVLKFAAEDDVRYYLNGVCLEVARDVAFLVATDGHRLGAVMIPTLTGENLVPGSFIIPSALIKGVRKAGRKVPTDVEIIIETPDVVDSPVQVTDGEVKLSGKLIDAKYPDWRRISPQSVSGKVAQFNPAYLKSFLEARQELQGKDCPPVISVSHNGDSPALIDIEDPNFVGVLMPCRTRAPLKAAREWALPVDKPEKRKVA